ncbi:3-phosphoserine/phosphohydroxythreonine transaminase [Mesoterricola silvestris]|uniref:Phosphoserine aminotransferase n=1 Tax=Mesoterricola silvestris TaxID=2927979 RepID=A0AA48K8G6_9BACT|nr:3-phosphoserine/phosphohydroxythreonine transaminase [Mesoterricola silvestris]BDU72110.1 phosphoserine aminotransferase [Mesoterricola silvestris]
MTNRAINFYAGPAGLPLPALERAKEELLDFAGTGMSVMEVSHRSKEYDAVHEEALALTRELMGIPANYKIILLQGGAHLSFGMIPLNFLRGSHKADYINTGNWAEKAYKEAKLVGGEERVRLAGSTKAENYARLPKKSELNIHPDSMYVHFTSNNTVEGTQWQEFPETGGIPYICDMSSDIMWRPFDVSKFGMIYAGAQKNLGPSGVTLHIVSDEFLEKAEAQDLPSYLRYKLHAEKNSLYNTPPTFGIYILRNVLAYNKSIGGLKAIEANNRRKGELLYGCIDKHAGFFKPFVTEKADRSLMNVDFFLPTEELTDMFVKEAKKAGMVGLKGYRDVGGIRVSTYNAVTVQNVETLVQFMEAFVKKNG